MKRFALFFVAALLSLSTAAAQNVTYGAGVHGGVAISAFEDNIKDYYGIGFGGGGHLDVNIVEAFTTRLNIEYFTFPVDQDKLRSALLQMAGLPLTTPSSVSGGSTNVFIVSVNAIGKIPTHTSVVPYGLFGFGIHNISLSDVTAEAQGIGSRTFTSDDLEFKTGTKFGLDFGIGSEFHLRSVLLSVEFKYVLVFTEDNSNGAMPITVGVTFPF